MPIRVVVPPAVEPVTTDQGMLWCRANEDDAPLIDMLIKAARERAENTTQRIFVQRTMEWTGPGFYPLSGDDWRFVNGGVFGFDRSDYYFAKLSQGFNSVFPQVSLTAPVQSITSVQYLDEGGALQTLPGAGYTLDANSEPGVIRYASGYALPAVLANRADAVRIRFLAGYPPDLTDPAAPDYRANLPGALLTWMQVQISTWFNQRESLETGGRLVETSRNFVEALLDGLIVSTRFV